MRTLSRENYKLAVGIDVNIFVLMTTPIEYFRIPHIPAFSKKGEAKTFGPKRMNKSEKYGRIR